MPCYALSVFAGFDVADLSEDAPDDVEGMDASAAHVANLLSTEPADSMAPKFFSLFLFGDGSHWLFINFIHPSYQTGTRCEIDHIAFAVIL